MTILELVQKSNQMKRGDMIAIQSGDVLIMYESVNNILLRYSASKLEVVQFEIGNILHKVWIKGDI